MATFFADSFASSALTGFTATTGPGSFTFPINYQPSLGDPNPYNCLKIGGGQSGWGQTGICMTTAIPNNPLGYMFFFQFSIDGGEAVISLETTNTLWTTNTNIVSIHYTQSGPLADLYSGTVNSYPDALNSNEWIDHFLEITATGAILGRHRHYTTPGAIEPFTQTRKWSLGSWGLTDIAQHQNYATASGVRLSISFNGSGGQACYLSQVFATTNGLIQRPPLTLAAAAASSSAIDLTWIDNCVNAGSLF